jgi:hypothetical protein
MITGGKVRDGEKSDADLGREAIRMQTGYLVKKDFRCGYFNSPKTAA